MSLEKQLEENTAALKKHAEVMEAFTKAILDFKIPTTVVVEKEDATAPETPASIPAPTKPEKPKKEKPAPAKDEPKAEVTLEQLREVMKAAAAFNRDEVVGWIAEYGTLTDVPESKWDALYAKAKKYVADKKNDALD